MCAHVAGMRKWRLLPAVNQLYTSALLASPKGAGQLVRVSAVDHHHMLLAAVLRGS